MRRFCRSIERLSYVTMEHAHGKTFAALAQELDLSVSRVSQLNTDGLRIAGCTERDPPAKIGNGLASCDMMGMVGAQADTPEAFYRFERWGACNQCGERPYGL